MEHLHYRTGKSDYDETYRNRSRFADDAAFFALISSRQKSVERLLGSLRGDGSQALYAHEPSEHNDPPKTFITAISAFSRDLLFDRGLPLGWRTYLWLWFIGRYMVKRGMLRPFVR